MHRKLELSVLAGLMAGQGSPHKWLGFGNVLAPADLPYVRRRNWQRAAHAKTRTSHD
jgi:hypothetical protein